MCDDKMYEPCGECEACRAEDLPVNPFVALRVAYGMLLGEDDFRTLMGNPRGKQMLHNAWLHGRGVVWGYPVQLRGELELSVGPGLALDGWGRELLLDHTECVNVRDWFNGLEDLPEADADDCDSITIRACLYAEFDCAPAEPVPTLADPCDITRQHDDYSRVVEKVRLVLRPEPCPEPPRTYHRVLVLLGLEELWGDDDAAGKQARDAAVVVERVADVDRPEELLRQLRCMAALDSADLRPAGDAGGGECCEGADDLGLFPVGEDEAGVPLACVVIRVRHVDECTEVVGVDVELCCRTALLPTATIQDLVAGLAPGTFGVTEHNAGGPRIYPEVTWEWADDRLYCKVRASRPIVDDSLRRAVAMTSLSPRGGWVEEDIIDVHYVEPHVVIKMADRPVNETIRLIIRGTGRMPAFGVDPLVPLAGLVGGPPGTSNDGHDAVLTFPKPDFTQLNLTKEKS